MAGRLAGCSIIRFSSDAKLDSVAWSPGQVSCLRHLDLSITAIVGISEQASHALSAKPATMRNWQGWRMYLYIVRNGVSLPCEITTSERSSGMLVLTGSKRIVFDAENKAERPASILQDWLKTPRAPAFTSRPPHSIAWQWQQEWPRVANLVIQLQWVSGSKELCKPMMKTKKQHSTFLLAHRLCMSSCSTSGALHCIANHKTQDNKNKQLPNSLRSLNHHIAEREFGSEDADLDSEKAHNEVFEMTLSTDEFNNGNHCKYSDNHNQTRLDY